MAPLSSLAIDFGPLQRRNKSEIMLNIHVCGLPSRMSESATAGRVTGQNGSGQNGTDKMVWTKWYADKMVLDKMVRTKWYGQNGTILYFMYIFIQLNSTYS